MSGYRRTWDKEEYAQRARERLEREGDSPDEDESVGVKRVITSASSREEFMPASLGSDGPMGSERAFLRARSNIVDTESKVGKIEIVRPQATAAGDGPTGPGFWCETCKCLLKDSSSYLDHINGKKHQRNLGFSMRVERVGLEAVKARIKALKEKKMEDKIRNAKPKVSAVDEYNLKISKLEEEEKIQKAQKKAEYALKAEKFKELKQQQKEMELKNNEVSEDDAAIAAMMGFSGFGSTKK
jgi:U4/U6.U5 tri-snRNP component SNU23